MDGPVTERDLPVSKAVPDADAGTDADARRAALLEPLFADRRLWRGQHGASADGIPSGHAALDAVLPDGGFPDAALTEVFVPGVAPSAGPLAGLLAGIGELALVLPALARLARGLRLIAFVAPPELPYAPALAAAGIDLDRLVVVRARDARDAAWAAEQALRDGGCAAVVAWLEGHEKKKGSSPDLPLRRLQLAAEAGECWGLLYRPWAARRSASPAALRLALTPVAGGLCVEVLKCRGSSVRRTVEVPLADAFAIGRG